MQVKVGNYSWKFGKQKGEILLNFETFSIDFFKMFLLLKLSIFAIILTIYIPILNIARELIKNLP